MKTKLTLAVGLLAVLGLAGCATSSKTDAPDAQTAPGTSAPAAPDATTDAAPKQDADPAMTPGSDAGLPSEWRVLFAFDSSNVTEESRKVIEKHGKYLSANTNIKVQLEGHTDERGTREYNLALGERRAQSVEKLLRVLGVTPDRISQTSFGEEKPIAPEHNEEGWAMNRRVEIIYQ